MLEPPQQPHYLFPICKYTHFAHSGQLRGRHQRAVFHRQPGCPTRSACLQLSDLISSSHNERKPSFLPFPAEPCQHSHQLLYTKACTTDSGFRSYSLLPLGQRPPLETELEGREGPLDLSCQVSLSPTAPRTFWVNTDWQGVPWVPQKEKLGAVGDK